MSTRRHAFKFSSVHRALRAAERAGFRPDHFKVDADGAITVFVKPESEAATAKGEGAASWDQAVTELVEQKRQNRNKRG